MKLNSPPKAAAPKGTKMLDVSDLSSYGAQERETILDSGLKYRVVGYEPSSSGPPWLDIIIEPGA